MDFLAGQSAGMVEDIQSAAEIIRGIAEQAERILKER
jgi:NAD(P)H-dependent flavin oxidoreductase YrpB (nitropropane dioxygenase family)